MCARQVSESEWIAWLADQAPRAEDVELGIGDDGAIVRLPGESAVLCSDMLLDGVHFLSDEVAPETIGHKALAVNLSDVAAMGAVPTAALVSIALPRLSQSLNPRRVYQGLFQLARRFDISIIGGDTTSWRGPLAIDVTVIGRPGQQTWRRGGALPGDMIAVTGRLGGSILGHHLTFTPRLADARFLSKHYAIHAAIDISDGLALDLWRLTEASACRASVEAASIPLSKDAYRLSKQDGKSVLEHALTDGEDFELLFTATADEMLRLVDDPGLPTPVSIVGSIEQGQGVELIDAHGDRKPLPRSGFEHPFGSLPFGSHGLDD